MAQFAERGFTNATIRGIADAAGVSTGLVQHHFGSKDGLRRACDEAVVESVRRQAAVARGVGAGEAPHPDAMAAMYDMHPLLTRYLVRLLADGSPAVAPVFDEFAAHAEAFLTDAWPERFPPGSARARDTATVMTVMHLGLTVLHEQLARRMGIDVTDRAAAPRLGLIVLDIYTAMGQWAGSDTGAQSREALAKYVDTLASSTTEQDKERDE
jgi:AcrR family transcriptional regulator